MTTRDEQPLEARWLTIWLDLSPDDAGEGRRFWSHAAGDLGTTGHLRLSLGAVSTSRVRLGLGVADVEPGVASALAAGAVPGDGSDPGQLRSPGGYAFTVEQIHPAAVADPVATRVGGHRSRIDQLTIDVAPHAWDLEVAFWRRVTGWQADVGASGEFTRVRTPPTLPVRILLQRRQTGETSAHLDLATDDREAEVARLVRGGARRLHDGPRWTVLQPPVGPLLCVTDRDPDTGLLAR